MYFGHLYFNMKPWLYGHVMARQLHAGGHWEITAVVDDNSCGNTAEWGYRGDGGQRKIKRSMLILFVDSIF